MISIIIPHRGSALGLWSTVHSCEVDLTRSGIEYEYVIVSNGEKVPREVSFWLDKFVSTGKAQHIHTDEPMSPPKARSVGVEASKGDIVFFLDNHCVVGQQYFKRALLDFEKPDCVCLHSTTCFHAENGYDYHYKLRLEFNFWAESKQTPLLDHKPYLIAAGGHGGFACTKKIWEEVGGYGPDDLLKGYGGEELMFDLKLWRLGYSVYLDPQMIHYHFAGGRGYGRHYTDEYYINMMVSALVIGGEKWFDRVYESFTNGQHIRISKVYPNMYDLMMTAYYRAIDYSRELDTKSVYDLDTLLKRFRLEDIAH